MPTEKTEVVIVGIGAVMGPTAQKHSAHPSIGGFNPTLTMQALAYYTADAIVNRYRKNPGPLV